jgi:hypothetical protein
MISQQAISGLETLFEHSIHEHSAHGQSGRSQVARRAQQDFLAGESPRHLVVQSISSYMFRIVTLFNFGKDMPMRSHLAAILRSTSARMEGSALLDGYAELANLICGSVNRGLSAVFPHAGMSTPFALDHACEQYVALLNPTLTHAYQIETDQAARFNMLVCICVARGSRLDFAIDQSAEAQSGSGELELF